jgi:hypothetical protein
MVSAKNQILLTLQIYSSSICGLTATARWGSMMTDGSSTFLKAGLSLHEWWLASVTRRDQI